MDPTPAELAGIANFQDACTWAGVTDALRDALEDRTGRIAVVRELVIMEDSEFTSALDDAMLTTAASTALVPAVTRSLKGVERARLLSLRRVARLLCGASADGTAAQAAASGGGGRSLQRSWCSRRAKASSLRMSSIR